MPKSWPHAIRVGSVRVSVYKVKRSGLSYFQVADYSSGNRKLVSFVDPLEALRQARKIAKKIAAGEVTAAAMKNKDSASYARAREILDPIGESLELASSRYAEAVAILGDGARLIAAAKEYAKRHPSTLPDKSVQKALEEFLASKEAQGASTRHLEDLRSRLDRFAGAFVTKVANVTPGDISAWMDSLELSPQSLVNYRRVIFSFFEFCKLKAYLIENPVEKITPPKVKDTEVSIFTPQEISRLLQAASPDFLPVLAIGAFAGLRSAELERLDWQEVDIAGRFITVTAGKAKTGSRRVVPMADNLAEWLAPIHPQQGPVWKGSHYGLYDAQGATSKAAGIRWKSNALRHSFASYRLAMVQDAAKVAHEMGNSANVVHKHYKELVRPDAAATWFSIMPTISNVIPMEVQA